ncbi:MAG: hypothetical protein OEY09_03120 [Gammaproteobacteria bacterium]|nr:hypothetical protein [Gammaproteobacteria bacterium]
MKPSTKKKYYGLIISSLLLLSACGGGGGGGETALAATSIVGSWQGTCTTSLSTGASASTRMTYQFNSDNTLSIKNNSFIDTDCTTHSGSIIFSNGTYTVGTTFTGSSDKQLTDIDLTINETIIQGVMNPGLPTIYNVYSVENNQLYMASAATSDPATRPTTVDTTMPYLPTTGPMGDIKADMMGQWVSSCDNNVIRLINYYDSAGPKFSLGSIGYTDNTCTTQQGTIIFESGDFTITPATSISNNGIPVHSIDLTQTSRFENGVTTSIYPTYSQIITTDGPSLLLHGAANGTNTPNMTASPSLYFGEDTATNRPTKINFDNQYRKLGSSFVGNFSPVKTAWISNCRAEAFVGYIKDLYSFHSDGTYSYTVKGYGLTDSTCSSTTPIESVVTGTYTTSDMGNMPNTDLAYVVILTESGGGVTTYYMKNDRNKKLYMSSSSTINLDYTSGYNPDSSATVH